MFENILHEQKKHSGGSKELRRYVKSFLIQTIKLGIVILFLIEDAIRWWSSLVYH